MNFQVFKLDIEKAEESESDGRSVMSNSLQLHGPYISWNSPGQNTAATRGWNLLPRPKFYWQKNGKRMALSRTYQAPVEVISELWLGFSIAHGIPL